MGLESINQRKRELGMTNEELAKRSGVPKSTIDKITSGRTYNPNLETVKAIVHALGEKLDFIDDTYIPEYDSENINSYHKITSAYEKAPQREKDIVERLLEPYTDNNIIKVDFRCSEQPASAGTGIYLKDEFMTTIRVSLDSLPDGYERESNRYFGVPVSGNSMEPKYYDGDILIVKDGCVNIGDIGVITYQGEGYVKQIGEGVLHSLNPEYEDIPINGNVHFNGKVVGVLKRNS